MINIHYGNKDGKQIFLSRKTDLKHNQIGWRSCDDSSASNVSCISHWQQKNISMSLFIHRLSNSGSGTLWKGFQVQKLQSNIWPHVLLTFWWIAEATASTMGNIMATVAVFDIHIERKAVVAINPNMISLGDVPTTSSIFKATLY